MRDFDYLPGISYSGPVYRLDIDKLTPNIKGLKDDALLTKCDHADELDESKNDVWYVVHQRDIKIQKCCLNCARMSTSLIKFKSENGTLKLC